MFKNYLIVTLRNLKRQKIHSFINIAGLAIGMACTILIFLWIQDEMSYDKFHKNAQRIYRVLSAEPHQAVSARTPYRLGSAMEKEFPEIKQAVRITWPWYELVSYKNKNFKEGIIYADSTIFEVFSFPLLEGDPRHALKGPKSVVISEEIAHKYFGSDDPMGKILTIDKEHEFMVSGIFKKIPRNSHFKFDLLAPISFMPNKFSQRLLDQWDFEEFFTYLLLSEDCKPFELEDKFTQLIERHIGEERPAGLKFPLQLLTDIHLRSSHIEWDIASHGNIAYVYLFSAIAIFVLLIACINYMNLSSARSSMRSKEVGLRKVVGANRFQLINQFLGESILFSLISLPLSIGLVEILLPFFNTFSGKELSIQYFENWPFLICLVMIVLLVGVVSGSHPAFVLSGIQPVDVFKSSSKVNKKALSRKGLVVFQFVVSVTLLICSIIIYRQIHFLKNRNLGFDKEHVVVVDMPEGEKKYDAYLALKSELLQQPSVLDVSAASTIPPNKYHLTGTQTVGDQDEKSLTMKFFSVDYNFIEMLGFELVNGRSFSSEYATDKKEAIIINEEAARQLGWNKPIGKRLKIFWNNEIGRVIGVVKDFHFKSLHEKIEPTVFTVGFRWLFHIVIRIRPGNIPNTLDFIKETWKKYNPIRPFDFSFVDENFDKLYRAEEKMGTLFGYFTSLAIIIACLGIFGLVSFSTENRTKEIGIRKVLGASVVRIIHLFSKEFIMLVLVANIIAWPIAYFVMNKWLQNFAYKINISWWTFLLAGVTALVIALLTVSYQAIKAATSNPVEALRYE